MTQAEAEQVIYGIDLGGTAIKLAASDPEGNLLAQSQRPTRSDEGSKAVIQNMAAGVRDLMDKTATRPAALGIGVPGIVDMRQGVVRYLPNFPTHWRDVALRQNLEDEIGCPVFLINDVKAATLGELTFGHGREARSMAFFALGTGIGGGVVIDGRLNLGRSGSAGEVGHLVVEPGGRPCGCGSRGCLETFASGPALAGEGMRLLRSGQAPILYDIVGGDPAKISPRTMGLAAEQGDAAVAKSIARAGHFLGIGIAQVIVTLEPELVVIGGGVAQLGDLLLNAVRETVFLAVQIYPPDSYRLETSALGLQAGVKGAVALAMQGGLLDQL